MSTMRPSPRRKRTTPTEDPDRFRSAKAISQRGSSASTRPAMPIRQISSAPSPSRAEAAGLAAVMRPSGVEKSTPSEVCSNMAR